MADIADTEELTPERRELLSLGARIIALEHTSLIQSIVLGVLAKAAHGVDLGPITRAAYEPYQDAAEREDFATGLSETERRFLADQIRQRLSIALKPLTSSSDGACIL
jgi:hypothetical protein